MTVVEAPSRETGAAWDDELLIREARQRARRRRWTIGLALLVVIITALAIVGGAIRIPPRATTAQPPASSRSGVSGGHSAAAPVVLGRQSVQSVWPVAGQTTWVFTMSETSLSRNAQVVEWTNNGGRTWRNASPAGYGNATNGLRALGGFTALSTTRAWVTAGTTLRDAPLTPRLLTTDNGGRSWTAVGTVPSASCTLSFSSTNDGICASSSGAGGSAPLALFVTHDGGRKWSKTFDNTAGFTAPAVVREGGLPYACDKEFSLTGPTVVWAKFWCNASAAILFRSNNSGRSWSPVGLTAPTPVRAGGAEFTGPIVLSGQRGAVAFTEGHSSLVYVTRDGGQSFSPVYPPGPVHAWAADIVSPTVWRLAYRDEILSTTSAGSTWTRLSDNATSTSSVERSLRFGSGAPATLTFTSTSFGWMSWYSGSGDIVLSTQNGGRTWRTVTIPGTGSRVH